MAGPDQGDDERGVLKGLGTWELLFTLWTGVAFKTFARRMAHLHGVGNLGLDTGVLVEDHLRLQSSFRMKHAVRSKLSTVQEGEWYYKLEVKR